MLLGGAFNDTVLQVTATVTAGVVIACLIAAVRFVMHVRDSVRHQDAVLAGIDKAVNHTPAGEPRLYDLAATAAKDSADAVQQVRILKSTVANMQTQNARRDVEWSDAIIDLRGEVAKVQTTLETLTE